MIRNLDGLLQKLRGIHEAIRDDVITACEQQSYEELSKVVADDVGDLIFAIDRVSEHRLLTLFYELSKEWSFVLIAEGLEGDGVVVLPEGTREEDAELRIIVDPIDGTRGIMYQKRPAWILTGVAPNKGSATNLSDIELAVQTEIPVLKQHLCDSFWAVKGEGAFGDRFNRITGEREGLVPTPSRAVSIKHGYGCIGRFFPGGRVLSAEIDDQLCERILGKPDGTDTPVFEDQYPSTGGMLHELMTGKDRWLADPRPEINALMRSQNKPTCMCCAPYDLCTELIAREAGVIITFPNGRPITARLEVHADVGWIGYANEAIQRQVEPVLMELFRKYGVVS